MVDLGYRDKRYLVKYSLDVELFNLFGLEVYDIIPVRKVFMLITNKGDKILKKINCTLEEFQFIIDAVDYIKPNYNKIMEFSIAKDNKKYAEWEKELYCIMNRAPGRECEYSNPIDLSIASEGIAEFHKASEGFRHKNTKKNICGNSINNFIRKREEMQFFQNMALMYENKSEFDEMFLKNVEYYINKIQDSITFLQSSQYYKLCSEEDKVVLCHHDLAHHNIIINDNEAWFIDFDYAVIDLKVHDICNFINKVIKNFAFDIDKAKLILSNYNNINEISKREMEVLYGMLIFPEDFYEISKDYYSKRKDWEEQIFISRFKRKIDLEEQRVDFLQDFKKEFLK